MLGVYVPPTAKVIRRRDLRLKSHPKDWRSPGSNSRPLVYKASSLITTPRRLLRRRLWQVFFHIWAWRLVWPCDLDHLIAHLSRRLIGELIVYPCSGARFRRRRDRGRQPFQTTSPLKPLGQSKPNLCGTSLGRGNKVL